MDFLQLSYFISVAQTLNFSEAARRNEVPQPTISRSIHDLERQIGAQLFVRTTRDVALTKEGEAFLIYAVDIMDTYDKALNYVKQIHQGLCGHFSIASISTMSHVLTECLSRFSKRYPEIFADVTYNTGYDEAIAISKNKFDVYFAPLAMLPANEKFDYLITEMDRLALIVPKGHPILNDPENFSLLKNERFLILAEARSPQLYSQVMQICAARNLSPNIVSRHEKAESVILAVAAGLGISILPYELTRVFQFDTFVPLPIRGEDAVRPYVYAWNKSTSNTCTKMFTEIVTEYCKDRETKETQLRCTPTITNRTGHSGF